MSISKTTSKFAGVLGAAALVLSLAACSGGQSVAEACSVIGTKVAESQADMQTPDEALSGGKSFSDLFTSAKDALVDAEKEIQNAEVSDSLKAISTNLDKAGELFKDIKFPDMADLDPTDPEAMAAFEDLRSKLEGKSAEMEELNKSINESNAKFQELCNI